MQSLPAGGAGPDRPDYTSPAGYLRAELFALLGPILFLVFAIGAGGRAVAGEEEVRSLDLLLSTPLTRTQIVRDKAIAVLSRWSASPAFLFVVVVVIGPLFDLTVPVADVAAACVMLSCSGCVRVARARGRVRHRQEDLGVRRDRRRGGRHVHAEHAWARACPPCDGRARCRRSAGTSTRTR